jgi:hypothetical protein
MLRTVLRKTINSACWQDSWAVVKVENDDHKADRATMFFNELNDFKQQEFEEDDIW